MQYRNNKARVCAGVTLVEMIIAVAIIVIVFTAITPLFRGILNSWDSKAGAAETVQNGRVLIDHLKYNLSKAVQITAVSDSNVTTGYIEFEDNDGNTLRYDVASSYVEFGVVGDLNDLAGPVSTLQFTCYDACDFNTAITDGNDIRFVQVQTTLTNSAPLGADRTFTTSVYLRTNWETGSGSGSDPNLVGWWKLDETSGLTAADSSGNGNDGTLTNMDGDEWTTGVVDGALEFDGGSDYIDTNYLQDGVSKYTISAWVNIPSGSTGNNVIVFDRGSGAGHSLTFGIGHTTTGELYYVDDSDSIIIGRYYNGGLNDDAWHHVVGVFDGGGSVTSSQFTVYLDGASVSTGTYDTGSDTAPLTGLGGTQIGHHIGWNRYFDGIIDDVRIYNRALSPAEVAELANILRYREFTEAKAASDTTSITISTPDTNEGDLLIAAVATDGDTSLSLAPPVGEGWTEIDVDDYGTEVTLGAWWKLAEAPESATHEFDWTGDEQAYGWMMRFTGHDASGPIDDSATDGESSSTPTSPAVTTTVSDALILRLGAFDDGDITVDDPCLSGHTAITMDSSGSGGGGGESKMYWYDGEVLKIQRANLDGSSIEDLVTSGVAKTKCFALDPTGGKMYWFDENIDKIERANLDGSSREDVITSGVTKTTAMAIDSVGSKIYWFDENVDKIQRADLDGSNIEDVITAVEMKTLAMAVDSTGGKLYWHDQIVDKIQRANLDGSSSEDLVTSGVTKVTGLALDIAAGKMYWADQDVDKIQRANLDGSSIEDVISFGTMKIIGLGLDIASGGGVVSGGAGYVKQSAAGDSGTSDFALTASQESQMLTIAIAPDPNSGGGGGGGEILP